MKTLLLISIVASLSSMTLIAKVYTWTDSDGVIHYSDRPIQGKEATELKQDKEINVATLAPKTNQFQQDYQKSKKDKAEQQSQSLKNQNNKAEYCGQLKGRLALFEEGGRIYNRTASGERSFYGDEGIDKEIKSLRATIKQKC
jgi:hypothetical protein